MVLIPKTFVFELYWLVESVQNKAIQGGILAVISVCKIDINIGFKDADGSAEMFSDFLYAAFDKLHKTHMLQKNKDELEIKESQKIS